MLFTLRNQEVGSMKKIIVDVEYQLSETLERTCHKSTGCGLKHLAETEPQLEGSREGGKC